MYTSTLKSNLASDYGRVVGPNNELGFDLYASYYDHVTVDLS